MSHDRLVTSLSTRVARDPLLQLLRACAIDTGAELYLVGGPVRDAALGQRCRDADLTVVRHAAPLIREIKRRLGTAGFRFRKRGVTTWRFATPSGDVDIVDAARRGLEHDLRRRELTINAMAYDLVDRRVIDPLGGLKDLRAKQLRAPGTDTFRADPARCLRAARFLAELPGFRVERDTRRQLIAQAPRLRRVAVERIREELTKLLGGALPHDGLAAVQQWGLLDPVLPELSAMNDCAAGRDRPDVWSHTVKTIEMSATRPRLPSFGAVRDRAELPLLRWTLLLHDIAKPATLAIDPCGKPTFHGHEELGAKMADKLLKRLKVEVRTRRRITQLIRWHLRPGHLADAGAPARGMRRLAREAGDDLPLLCLHAACDARGSGGTGGSARWRRMSHVLRTLPQVQSRLRRLPDAPLLSGADVLRATGLPPGPKIGKLLRELAEARDDGAISTRRQALAYLKNAGR
jgi:poly(A) polymerase